RKSTRRGLRNSHSALNDCKTTYSLLLEIVRTKGIKSFEELYEFSEQARYPTHIFYGKYKGWAIKDMDDRDIHWLMNKTLDGYLHMALENELLSRNSIDEEDELPFI
ncbi:3'-5' exonuclease, partial [Acinetobacter baumannii]|nr:3'-5' exonuclease [Acinetobacter baumannii]